MVASRTGAAVPQMVYAGSLPFLVQEWQLSGVQAGMVQGSFNLCYAASLLLCSLAADRLGPARIFAVANWASAAAFLACALFARSFESGLLLFGLLALTLGGAYTPALMLVARAMPADGRGSAVGWLLAGSSVGYFAAIAALSSLGSLIGYESVWLLLAPVPLASAIAGQAALASRVSLPGTPVQAVTRAGVDGAARTPALLTAGYAAHCWELLGMWAWAPAFLMLTLSESTSLSPVAIGLLAAAALHLSGAAGTIVGGVASDVFGRRTILLVMALAGAFLSFVFGWSGALGPLTLVVVAALYGFATISDSGPLTAAMADAVPAKRLGTALAVRSIFGFGAGAAAPIVFGWVLDITLSRNGAQSWGAGFAVLGLGGAIAAACAAKLPRDRSGPP